MKHPTPAEDPKLPEPIRHSAVILVLRLLELDAAMELKRDDEFFARPQGPHVAQTAACPVAHVRVSPRSIRSGHGSKCSPHPDRNSAKVHAVRR